MPEPIPGRGGRRVRWTGGKILHVHVNHNEKERWHELLPGSVLFWLVAPPLHQGVVGPSLVWGV
jgi:hypothetical protein